MASTSGDIGELLGQLPIGDIAAKLGIGTGDATDAIKQALPALLGGMAGNVKAEGGAAALEQALGKHGTDGSLPGVDAIDVEDGRKIVRHVLGDKQGDVVSALAGSGGEAKAGMLSKLLPMLAPLVMAFLANKMGGGKSAGSAAPAGGGGGIGDILGGLLGGGGGAAGGLGGGLGDVLGGILGGGSDPEPTTVPKSGGKTTTKAKTAQKQSGGFLGGLLSKIFGR